MALTDVKPGANQLESIMPKNTRTLALAGAGLPSAGEFGDHHRDKLVDTNDFYGGALNGSKRRSLSLKMNRTVAGVLKWRVFLHPKPAANGPVAILKTVVAITVRWCSQRLADRPVKPFSRPLRGTAANIRAGVSSGCGTRRDGAYVDRCIDAQ